MKIVFILTLLSLSAYTSNNKLAAGKVPCSSYNSYPIYLKIDNSFFSSEYLTFGINLDSNTCHFHQDNFNNVIYWKKKQEEKCSTVANFISKHSKPENSNFTYINKNQIELRMKTMVDLNKNFPNAKINEVLTIESEKLVTGKCSLKTFILHNQIKKQVKEIFIKLNAEFNPLPSAKVTDGNVKVKNQWGIQEIIKFK